MPKLKDIDFDEVNVTPGRVFKWCAIGVVTIGALGVIASFTGVFTSVATAPSRVIEKTMHTDNIINNYEWFHDANAQYRSRLGQIVDFKRQLEGVGEDRAEKNRLNVDLGATRQSCRDLATRYNANSTKSNRSIFMGREAPVSLSMEACG